MKLHPVFKPNGKKDHIRSAYIYKDGHVVVVFEGSIYGVEYTYAKIAQSVGIRVDIPSGRITFHDGTFLVIAAKLEAKSIRVVTDDISHGSKNTKDRNIPIGYLALGGTNIGRYGDPSFTSVGGMDPGWYLQTDMDATFDPNCTLWGDHKVTNVYLDEKKAE